jgi:hypothetical protein
LCVLQGVGAPCCARILTSWFAAKERGTYWGERCVCAGWVPGWGAWVPGCVGCQAGMACVRLAGRGGLAAHVGAPLCISPPASSHQNNHHSLTLKLPAFLPSYTCTSPHTGMWNIAHNMGGFFAPILAGTAAKVRRQPSSAAWVVWVVAGGGGVWQGPGAAGLQASVRPLPTSSVTACLPSCTPYCGQFSFC